MPLSILDQNIYIEKIIQALPTNTVKSIFLVGSYAKSKNTYNSDVDFIVISDCFKNISGFTGKLKGLFEVRDLSNLTRVVFDINDNGEYCIIAVIPYKSETNSIYQTRLVSRYKLYKQNVENINSCENMKLLLKSLLINPQYSVIGVSKYS